MIKDLVLAPASWRVYSLYPSSITLNLLSLTHKVDSQCLSLFADIFNLAGRFCRLAHVVIGNRLSLLSFFIIKLTLFRCVFFAALSSRTLFLNFSDLYAIHLAGSGQSTGFWHLKFHEISRKLSVIMKLHTRLFSGCMLRRRKREDLGIDNAIRAIAVRRHRLHGSTIRVIWHWHPFGLSLILTFGYSRTYNVGTCLYEFSDLEAVVFAPVVSVCSGKLRNDPVSRGLGLYAAGFWFATTECHRWWVM